MTKIAIEAAISEKRSRFWLLYIQWFSR